MASLSEIKPQLIDKFILSNSKITIGIITGIVIATIGASLLSFSTFTGAGIGCLAAGAVVTLPFFASLLAKIVKFNLKGPGYQNFLATCVIGPAEWGITDTIPLPSNLQEIVSASCPFNLLRRIYDTHLLVYVVPEESAKISVKITSLFVEPDKIVGPYWALILKETIPSNAKIPEGYSQANFLEIAETISKKFELYERKNKNILCAESIGRPPPTITRLFIEAVREDAGVKIFGYSSIIFNGSERIFPIKRLITSA